MNNAYVDVAIHGGMIALLGFFIKVWMDDTRKSIEDLRVDKVDFGLWQAEHKNLVTDVAELKCDVQKIEVRLGDIDKCVAIIPDLRVFQLDLKATIKKNSMLLRENMEPIPIKEIKPER